MNTQRGGGRRAPVSMRANAGIGFTAGSYRQHLRSVSGFEGNLERVSRISNARFWSWGISACSAVW